MLQLKMAVKERTIEEVTHLVVFPSARKASGFDPNFINFIFDDDDNKKKNKNAAEK